MSWRKYIRLWVLGGMLSVFFAMLAFPYLRVSEVYAAGSCTLVVNLKGLGAVATTGGGDDPSLAVDIGAGNSYLQLENSRIKVRYEPFTEGHSQFAIRSFIIKSAGNQEQISTQYLDADAGRGTIDSITLLYDGPDQKTVQLVWSSYATAGKKITHTVSIFPNSDFLKMEYQDVQYGTNLVDLGNPGGTSAATHTLYGASSWVRGYVTFSDVPNSYYNRYPPDGVNDPADGGSLNYNGHFIMGVYNPANNIGFGRTLPITDISIVKLLLSDTQRKGFELYPYPFYLSHSPFTGYLYAITGGATGMLATGQMVADGTYGPYGGYQCGDVVQMTAIPQSGWTFAGWTGDVSGTLNPESLTLLTTTQIVTANFVQDTTPPNIDVWYGNSQTFGTPGMGQQWLNILGTVADTETQVTSLIYSLNGVLGPVINGVAGNLMMGPHPVGPAPIPDDGDPRRLYFAGDFNVDISKDDPTLVSGTNTLVLTATNASGLQATKTVTITYNNVNTVTLPYTIDWTSGITDAQQVLQIVDGKWTWSAAGIRTSRMAYDRVLDVGDMAWDNFEVTVPITIHNIDPNAYNSPVSIGPGVGVGLLWQGHTFTPTSVSCLQPRCGWEPTGATVWYEWKQFGLDKLSISAEPSTDPNTETDAIQFQTGSTYWFKQRVTTAPSGERQYSAKVWEAGVQTEPLTWTLQRRTQAGNLPVTGSVILVAHHVDATFGNVTITPLNTATALTVSTTAVGSGTINLTPAQASYNFGDTVTATAVASSGWIFSSWAGDLSGTQNPATLFMDSDKAITATFTTAVSYTVVTTTIGSGTVTLSPNQAQYLQGTTVTATAVASTGAVFNKWLNDLSGNTNPNVFVVDKNMTITAKFLDSSTLQPVVSDDFDSCVLNTGTWSYIDPLSDTTLTMTGTHAVMTLPAGSEHQFWDTSITMPRLMQFVSDTDFDVIAKFDSGVSAKYQTQGIAIKQDDTNWLRFEFFGDGTGNTTIFAGEINNGTSTPIVNWGSVITNASVAPLYMRVIRSGDQWTQAYSFDGSVWQTHVISYSHPMTVTAVGVYGGNESNGASIPAHTTSIDYFYNANVPGTGDAFSNKLTTAIAGAGSGSVVKNPDLTDYTCGQVVTVTATADVGSTFSGWSGAATGTTNPVTVTMTADQSVTATFDTFRVFLPLILKN